MVRGYSRPDPVELFQNRAAGYLEMIEAAECQGFTRQEAIELLKIDALRLIQNELENR